ncbi:hypothetical protein ECZU36_58150 [Escherichia coli]|nr:hypothetical protein ECZU36_54250 [Escherichia coli]GHL84531.1 hypothetical protein ECZU36_58150 [Escherichia coli]
MIGEAGRVGVVLLDPQVGLVVQQAVEHIGGIADADIHHAGAERRVLVGDMGIEQPSRLATVLRVDVPGALARPPARKRWPSEDEVVPSPQWAAKAWRYWWLTSSAKAAE